MAVHSPKLFPDQGAKLRYLITIRGDRRERSRANPTLARDAGDGGHPRDVRSPIVINQAGLAAFLDVHPSEASRWSRDRIRVPDRLLGELCRLYAIDENDFRTLSLAAFVAAYGDPAMVLRTGVPALSALWRSLLGAASGHAEILPRPPADDTGHHLHTGRLRYATAHHPRDAEPLPEVAQGAPFWIRLVSPQRTDAGLTWVGWQIVLLNHDLARDGFRALLPRETNDPAHWTTRMPTTGWLVLPQAPILRHEAPDLGVFAMVAVLTREPLPPAILDAISHEQVHGLALEPALDALTEHLAVAMQGGRAGLAVARYRVVAPEADRTDA